MRAVPQSWSLLSNWNTSRPPCRVPLHVASRRWRALEGNPSSKSWQRDTDMVAELLSQVMDESTYERERERESHLKLTQKLRILNLRP